jgi:hypothetical protein
LLSAFQPHIELPVIETVPLNPSIGASALFEDRKNVQASLTPTSFPFLNVYSFLACPNEGIPKARRQRQNNRNRAHPNKHELLRMFSPLNSSRRTQRTKYRLIAIG